MSSTDSGGARRNTAIGPMTLMSIKQLAGVRLPALESLGHFFDGQFSRCENQVKEA
jgi:hypothetical protein